MCLRFRERYGWGLSRARLALVGVVLRCDTTDDVDPMLFAKPVLVIRDLNKTLKNTKAKGEYDTHCIIILLLLYRWS